MKCRLCGKSYVLLSSHIRKSHKIDPADYRREFNIPLTEALADGELREHLSEQALLRLKTDEGIEHLRRMRKNSPDDGSPGPRDLPECSTQHLHQNNARQSKVRREDKVPDIVPDWKAGMSNRDIAIKHGVAMCTLRKWERDGWLPKRRKIYLIQKVDQ